MFLASIPAQFTWRKTKTDVYSKLARCQSWATIFATEHREHSLTFTFSCKISKLEENITVKGYYTFGLRNIVIFLEIMRLLLEPVKYCASSSLWNLFQTIKPQCCIKMKITPSKPNIFEWLNIADESSEQPSEKWVVCFCCTKHVLSEVSLQNFVSFHVTL